MRWQCKYGSELDLSKNILSVESSCDSNNDDFEEITGEKKDYLLIFNNI
jgi:hypothetical protein